MKHRKLGKTDLDVSLICLGTMTWGEQNTQEEGFEQMHYAVEQGVNFFDTAELYAIPPKAETYGRTEEIIGNWFKETGKRKDIILATKVVGPINSATWIREGKPDLSREDILRAVENSLKRLKTDYIDLYQVHWPKRNVNSFSRRGFQFPNVTGQEEDGILETLETLSDLITAGKVRHIGLSNETPWGVSTYLKLQANKNLQRIVSIQNPYNLLDRIFEYGLAEIALQENVGLLAYSPMAAGSLSGKYLGEARPKGARWTLDGRGSRYDKPNGHRATEIYVEIAKKHGLDPAQMALAFVNSRPFVTSNIIGATKIEQLKKNIASVDIELSDEVLTDINAVHEQLPNPCP